MIGFFITVGGCTVAAGGFPNTDGLILMFFSGLLFGGIGALIGASLGSNSEGPQVTSKSKTILEIEELAKLKEKGILSEEEFEKKKNELLDKI